jgi:uncharacterized cupin superfamily protein
MEFVIIDALDFLSGLVAALVAFNFFVLGRSRRYFRNLLRLSPSDNLGQTLQMRQQMVSQDWIKSGTPIFHTGQYAESPDKRASSGIWSCEGTSTFEWQFGSDESVLVLDGRVEIDYLGQHFVLESGGTALFYAGTRATWHVPQYVRKTYMIYYPNYMVRWARRVFGISKVK